MFLWLTFSGFFASFIAWAFAPNSHRKTVAIFLSIVPLASLYYFWHWIDPIEDGVGYLPYTLRPLLPLLLPFRIDGLGLYLSFLLLGPGFLISVYASEFTETKNDFRNFYPTFFILLACFSGLFFSEHLILSCCFWTLGVSAIPAFIQSSTYKSWFFLILATLGWWMAALLTEQVGGTFYFHSLPKQAAIIQHHSLYGAILISLGVGLISTGAFFLFGISSKSKLPALAWTDLTLSLGSAFFLMRFFPALGGTSRWLASIPWIGIALFLGASFQSLLRKERKEIVAALSFATLGLVVGFLGAGHPVAVQAGTAILGVGVISKFLFYFSEGAIQKSGQTSGLWKYLPFCLLGSLFAFLNTVGVPYTPGFGAIRLAWDSLMTEQSKSYLSALVLVTFSVQAYSMSLLFFPFFGKLKSSTQKERVFLWWPSLILVFTAVLAVVSAQNLEERLLTKVISAVIGVTSLFPFNPTTGIRSVTLLKTLVPMALGIAIAIILRKKKLKR